MLFLHSSLRLEEMLNIYVRARCSWIKLKKSGAPKPLLDYFRKIWRDSARATRLSNKDLGREFRKRWVDTDFEMIGNLVVDPVDRCENCKYFFETQGKGNQTITKCKIFDDLLAVCDKFEER